MNTKTTFWPLCAVCLLGLMQAGLSCRIPEEEGVPPLRLGEDHELIGQVDFGEEPVDVTVVTPRFELGAEGFWRTPWPADFRLKDTGALDLGDFPNATALVLRLFRRELETIKGFATMPVVYLPMDTAMFTDVMPSPRDTLQPEGAVQLMELGERCGTRIPVLVDMDLRGDKYVDANMLRATPLSGFILEPATTYGLVVKRDFHPSLQVKPAPEAIAALSGEGALAQTFAPLSQCLMEQGIAVEELAVATVFTTQDPIEGMRKMRDVVRDPERVQHAVLKDFEPVEGSFEASGRSYKSYEVLVEMPMFQEGATPYRSLGGLVFGEDGMPEVQRYEDVPVVISVPPGVQEPAPVLVWSSGTWATLRAHLSQELTRGIAAQGFVVISFAPQFHEPRAMYSRDDIANLTFNYLNPPSGRTVFRQQAAEAIYLARVIRDTLSGYEGLPVLDTDRMIYGGHSQGAIVGAILAGVSDDYVAYGLNGIGGYVSSTIIGRKDYLDVERTLRDAVELERPLDLKHPIVQLAQTGVEVVDPHNYAKFWLGQGDEEHHGVSVFLVNGGFDETTPRAGINSVTVAGDLAILHPSASEGWDVEPYSIWEREEGWTPFSGNKMAKDAASLTQATYLVTQSDHFTVYDVSVAYNYMLSFWATAYRGTPVVAPRIPQ
ncbi:MAG: hypothetical protein AAGI01_03240 [Myxococcota bacterium]